jgi:hypothetical protein
MLPFTDKDGNSYFHVVAMQKRPTRLELSIGN